MALRHNLSDLLEVKDQIPYPDFLRKAMCSSALLYLDAAGQRYFNPGKLSDYFGAGRPVLGYAEVGSEAAAMLEQCGMQAYVSDPRNLEDGMSALSKCWQDWRAGVEPEFSTELFSVDCVCGEAHQRMEKLSSS